MTDALKILIIDDSEDDRLLYRRALKDATNAGYTIIEAEDGEKGLTHLGPELPDCILLDYSLPGHNGVEVLKRIRTLHPFAAIVMLTGQGNEAVAVTAMQEGAQNYIAKSTITAEALQRVIHAAIERCALQKRIHEQRTSLEIFTRALAHDLKEPVRTITSFMGLLAEEETLSEKGRTYMSYISNAAGRMGTLIEMVYFYLRLDSSEGIIRNETCDFTAITSAAMENINELIRERGAVITTSGLPQNIPANRIQMLQLIQNLVCNAIQHCNDGPAIHIAAEEMPDHWRLSVTDNGPGIDAGAREKIFEPFTRLVRHEKQGLGLGLAICKKIMESHGGRLWCEASPTGSAVFLFTLPKAALENAGKSAAPPATAVEARDEPPCPAAAQHKLANVLLVEDNEADIVLTRILLLGKAQMQCDLSIARSGQEALDMLHARTGRADAFDLLLLDINMPGMNGFELLEQMKKEEGLRTIPVVMCTTSAYDKDIERALALGASGYMSKPPEIDRLKPIIETLPGIELEAQNGGYAVFRAG